MGETYDRSEQDELMQIFTEMLWSVTGDGGNKRSAGLKPSWKVDPSHEPAIFSHLSKWKHGETQDPDSLQHPLVHLAWRALAIAWQETHTSHPGSSHYHWDGTPRPGEEVGRGDSRLGFVQPELVKSKRDYDKPIGQMTDAEYQNTVAEYEAEEFTEIGRYYETR